MAFHYLKKWDLITCSQDQNCYNSPAGVRGILDIDQVKEMEEATPFDERKARRYGYFAFLAGKIFKEFRSELSEGMEWMHVFPHDEVFHPSNIHVLDWTTYTGIDTHPVKDFFALAAKVDTRDRIYIFNEFIETDSYKMAARLRSNYKKWGGKPRRNMIEPQAVQGKKGSENKKSIQDQFQQYGIRTEQWQKHDTPRINEIRKCLAFDGKYNGPRLLISDKCQKLIWQLNHWCYDKKSKIQKENDDLIDCLGGIVCAKPKYRPKDGIPTREYKQQEGSHW